MLLAMLFAYSTALTLVLSSYGLPSQILTMLPYLMVLIVLLVVGVKKYKGIDISNEVI
jgi:simple sugar transport system permease protein